MDVYQQFWNGLFAHHSSPPPSQHTDYIPYAHEGDTALLQAPPALITALAISYSAEVILSNILGFKVQ